MSRDYKDETFGKAEAKLDELIAQLPRACTEFLRSRSTEPTSRVTYAHTLKMFFDYLTDKGRFAGKEPRGLLSEDVYSVTRDDIKEFISDASTRPSRSSKKAFKEAFASKVGNNTLNGYLCAISSFYEFLQVEGRIDNNPAKGIRRAKKDTHEIIYLEHADADQLIDNVFEGTGLTKLQRACRDKHDTAIRDACMIKILCNTGIRVSELVGLDVDDYEKDKKCLHIIRKGNKEARVYLSDEASELLDGYLDNRDSYSPVPGEKAIFLVAVGTYKGTRISVRSVEKLVHKYADTLGVYASNQVAPHKLRSTFAMNLLEKTGDIALVQKRLGHKNAATTAIYAETLDSKVESSRNLI